MYIYRPWLIIAFKSYSKSESMEPCHEYSVVCMHHVTRRCLKSPCCNLPDAQIVIEFKSDDDNTLLKPPERVLMYLPGTSQLTVKDLLAMSQVTKDT